MQLAHQRNQMHETDCEQLVAYDRSPLGPHTGLFLFICFIVFSFNIAVGLVLYK